MKIELRNIKYAAFASQETSCFQAAVYIDGAKAGEVSNEGTGGCDNFYPYSLKDRLDAYGKTLPKRKVEGIDDELECNAESLVGDLLTAYLVERDVKRLLAKRLAYTKRDAPGIYQSKPMPKERLSAMLADPALPSKIKGCDKVLNLLPLAEAVELYRAAA